MAKESKEDETIENLELVHWVEEKDSMRGQAAKNGKRVTKPYKDFDELYSSILEHGPLVCATDLADVCFFTPCGEFDGHIIAVRQSGRNVRRILVRSDHFDELFGTVQNCINHVLSNNVPECAIEMKHLHDLAEALDISTDIVDSDEPAGRVEVDVLAALQLLEVLDECFEDSEERQAVFEIGFSVGRLFSSAQNIVTLEPDAAKAARYEDSYVERGKKGKSKVRRLERMEHLFAHLVDLTAANEALSRLKPIEVAKLALEDASKENPKLWTQGGGQLEKYLTTYASDPKYKEIYYSIFGETG